MKHFRIILSITITIAVFSFSTVHAKATPNIAIADTVGYQCPMKCEGEKTYDKAGKCPVCNMNLKAISKPVSVGYQCPMKCEGEKTYAKEGKCPVCNMKLSKLKAKKEKQNYEDHNHN